LYTARINEQITTFKSSVGRIFDFSGPFGINHTFKTAGFYPDLKVYTSDFALWWWDYKAGYDVSLQN
jgi:hypothetical protein